MDFVGKCDNELLLTVPRRVLRGLIDPNLDFNDNALLLWLLISHVLVPVLPKRDRPFRKLLRKASSSSHPKPRRLTRDI